MILASDYRYYQTYAIFNYKEFNWLTGRNNGEGYQWNVNNYKNLFTSGSPSAYQLPQIRGERGIYIILRICELLRDGAAEM